jgi:chromate reductase
VSRPWGDNTWAGKPAGVISSSISLLGGARAQYPLRQTLQALSLQTLTQPEVCTTPRLFPLCLHV